MVICGICSYENQPHAKFCSGCGNKVRRSCPQCEAPLKPFDVFCSQCGYSVLQRCCVCNQINPEDSKFCFSCGSLVKNQCLGCGYVNLPDQKFCGNCQRPLKSSVVGHPQLQSPPVSVPHEPASSSEEISSVTLKMDKPRGQVVQEVVPEFLPELSNPPVTNLVAVDTPGQPIQNQPLVSENRTQPVKPSIVQDSLGVQEVQKTFLKAEATHLEGHEAESSGLEKIAEPVITQSIPQPTPQPLSVVEEKPFSQTIEIEAPKLEPNLVEPKMTPISAPPAMDLTEYLSSHVMQDAVEYFYPNASPESAHEHLPEHYQDKATEEVSALLNQSASTATDWLTGAYELSDSERVTYEQSEVTSAQSLAHSLPPASETAYLTPDSSHLDSSMTQESGYAFPDLDSSAPVEAEIKEWKPHSEEPASEMLYQEPMTSAPPSMLGKVDILELNPSLDVFALASIEITKSVQKSGQATKPEPDSQAWDQFRKEVVASIQKKLATLNAVIESVHHHILFIAFPKEESTEASALKAVKTALAIVSEVHHFHSQPIKIRVGIDLEHANLRNPIVSTTERTIAKPGGIVVSEAVYPYVEDRFDFDTVGPLKVGNQMLTFYQVLSSIPDTPYESPPDSHSSEPVHSRPIAEYIPLEPVSQQISSVGETYPRDAELQEITPLKVDHPIASLKEPLVPEEEPVLETFKPLDIYRPPIFGMIHTPRQPAYTYEAGYQALQDEIKFFLTNPAITSGQDTPSGNGKVLSVSASQGLGKTYILDAIHMQISQSELGQRVFWLASKNYRFLQDSQLPLSLWLDWLQVSFGLGMEGNNAEDAKNTIIQSLNFLYGGTVPEDVSDFFLDFLSVGALTPISMMSQSNIGRIEHYISGFLHVLQSQKPVVMVIEDLQYADAASLDLLVRLLNRGVLELNVCFVISHPRDFYADGPLAEAFQKYPYKEFVIGNLTEPESYAFLQEGPLQGTYDTFPPGLIQQIVSKSNGLPIYLLEVLRYLHLQGVLRIQQVVLGNNTPAEKLVLNEQYAKTVEAMILPNSVDDIIWQRLHHLSKSAFFTVQMASVIGEKFSLGVLQDLCGTPNESEFQQILKELFDQSWIVPDVVNTGRFTNGMCWDKAYESIEPQARQQYHRLVSEYLMEGNNANPRFAVHPGQIAHHSEKGGLINRSFQFWNLVGVHCAQLGSISGLNRGLFKALSLLKDSQLENPVEIEIQIRENLGFLNIQEDPELALNLLQSVYQFAQSQQNFSKQVQLLGLLANCHEGVGEYHEAQIYLEKALQLIEKDQYPLEYASFLTTRLEGLFNLGKLQKGLDIIENELEPLFKHPHFSAQNLQSDPIYLNGYFSSQLIKAKIFVCQCNDKAFDVIDQMLESLHPEQFPEMFLSFHLVRCQGYLRKGQYEKCQNTLQSLMGDIQSIGSPPRLMAQWGLLAIVFYIELGNYETAQSYLDNTLEQAELAKDYLTYLMTANYSAYLAYKLNQFDEAKDTLEKTITDSCEYRFASAALMGWRFMAELDLAQGHVKEALKFSTQALEIANRSEMRNLSEAFYLTTLRSACLMGTNQSKEAGVILQEMWPTVSQTGFLPVMAEFASTIGLLYKNLASKVPTQEQSQKNSQRANEFFQKSIALWNQTGNQFQMQRVSGFVN